MGLFLFLGMFKTLQLLELSGIADRSLLKSFSIETLIDLPDIGENLLDQTYTLIVVHLIRQGIQMGVELALEEVQPEDHDNKDDLIQAIRMRPRIRSSKRNLHGEHQMVSLLRSTMIRTVKGRDWNLYENTRMAK